MILERNTAYIGFKPLQIVKKSNYLMQYKSRFEIKSTLLVIYKSIFTLNLIYNYLDFCYHIV